MKVSPLRALTHPEIIFEKLMFLSRNESKPVEGIDTLGSWLRWSRRTYRRNESKPVEGIDTFLLVKKQKFYYP